MIGDHGSICDIDRVANAFSEYGCINEIRVIAKRLLPVLLAGFFLCHFQQLDRPGASGSQTLAPRIARGFRKIGRKKN
jgi:hypothetical protein